MAIDLGKDLEPFQQSEGVFNDYPHPGKEPVSFLVLLRKRSPSRLLLGDIEKGRSRPS